MFRPSKLKLCCFYLGLSLTTSSFDFRDKSNHRPVLFDSVFWVSLPHFPVYPSNPIPVPRAQDSFSLCTIAKNSCTNWRKLLYNVLSDAGTEKLCDTTTCLPVDGNGNNASTFILARNLSGFPHVQVFPDIRHPSYGQTFFENFPSLVIVRNPYLRFLSFYLDKVALSHVHDDEHGSERRTSSTSFHVNISEVARTLLVGSDCNEHWCPQSRQCGIAQGLRYTHVLKLEEMSAWFPKIVKLLNIESFVIHGWKRYAFSATHATLDHPADDCFYSPPEWSCSRYIAQRLPEQATKRKTLESCLKFSAHSTCAAVAVHLLTPEVVAIINTYYKHDFEMFNYELWDGHSPPNF